MDIVERTVSKLGFCSVKAAKCEMEFYFIRERSL